MNASSVFEVTAAQALGHEYDIANQELRDAAYNIATSALAGALPTDAQRRRFNDAALAGEAAWARYQEGRGRS